MALVTSRGWVVAHPVYAPRALVQMLTKMESTPVAADYQAALPVLGVAGSVFEDEGIISNYLYESL